MPQVSDYKLQEWTKERDYQNGIPIIPKAHRPYVDVINYVGK